VQGQRPSFPDINLSIRVDEPGEAAADEVRAYMPT
jgi:hypothetical protein